MTETYSSFKTYLRIVLTSLWPHHWSETSVGFFQVRPWGLEYESWNLARILLTQTLSVPSSSAPLFSFLEITSVQSLSCVWLFATLWTAAYQASLSITNSWSLHKLMSIELVMPCNHLILCCPLLLLPSIFPSTRVFSNEPVLHIRWPKYWSFSWSIS